MSRRDGRDSHGDSKRLHSRFDREPPSPKKSRRDGKPETEKRYSSNYQRDSADNDSDRKQRRRLQDALPLEDPPETKPKVKTDAVNEGLEGKVGDLGGNRHPSDPKEGQRSRSYLQHDERGTTRHGGSRDSGRRATEDRRWSDPKNQSRDRFREKLEPQQTRARDNGAWRHDGFAQMEAEAPPARKRPAFREKKSDLEVEAVPAAAGQEQSRLPAARNPDRSQNSSGFNRERTFRRGDNSYQGRERFGGDIRRGGDRFNGRSGGVQVEKWKHDMYDEANKSPSPKNEEEQIAKIEALLAL